MKKCKNCGAEKAVTEFYESARVKGGRLNVCKACKIKMADMWQRANKERHAAHCAKSIKKHAADANRRSCAWKARNRAAMNEANKRYNRLHPAQVNNRNGRHRAEKLRATPKWANKFFISEAYELAALRTRLLGAPWEVDHVVPLRSPIVCGLHVEGNLQVIPAVVNQIKGNRYWPNMPEQGVRT